MGRKKAEVEEGATPKPRRIGIELADALTEEIADYCASRPFLKEHVVKDQVRETARAAAEAATLGQVAAIMAGLLK